jgi:hypothetical protein
VALEGNLKDFSLADVFRLLASGTKSGILHVQGTEAEGIVCFRDGRVLYARSHGASEPAAKQLVSAGIISEKQLRQAQGLMKIQKKDKAERRLGQILVDEGYVEAPVLEAYIQGQISDALFDLLRWEEGQIRFDADQDSGDVDLGLAVSIDAVLADSARRIELWNKIKEKIPSMETRFAMSSTPGQKPTDIHLKPREWMLLCNLHGSRSVRELVSLTGYSDFETARVLYGMYAGGLIEKVGPAGEPLAD